jgi:hypothetical protein
VKTVEREMFGWPMFSPGLQSKEACGVSPQMTECPPRS